MTQTLASSAVQGRSSLLLRRNRSSALDHICAEVGHQANFGRCGLRGQPLLENEKRREKAMSVHEVSVEQCLECDLMDDGKEPQVLEVSVTQTIASSGTQGRSSCFWPQNQRSALDHICAEVGHEANFGRCGLRGQPLLDSKRRGENQKGKRCATRLHAVSTRSTSAEAETTVRKSGLGST